MTSLIDDKKEKCVHIDHFRVSSNAYQCGKLFFLTHAHGDHTGKSLSSFPFAIYCSPITARFIQYDSYTMKIIKVKPWKWYRRENVRFFVFKTLHCPGSIGFFFPDFNTLVLGDTRITPKITQMIQDLSPFRDIVIDSTLSTWEKTVPSVRYSAKLLRILVRRLQGPNKQKKNVCVCVPHIGTILLFKILKWRCKLDSSLSVAVRRMLDMLQLNDSNFPIVAVGRAFKKTDIIVSSFQFVLNDWDPFAIYFHENIWRIFVSFHASAEERKSVMRHIDVKNLNIDISSSV